MTYFHELDTNKSSPLYPEYREGYFFDDNFVDDYNLTEEQKRLVKEKNIPLEYGYFLCEDEPWGCFYGPCLYDITRDVFENCDGFEIRNENYEEVETVKEIEETLEYRLKRYEEKIKELELKLKM